MYLPGDGRVTRASVMGENITGTHTQSLYYRPLPIVHAFFANGGDGVCTTIEFSRITPFRRWSAQPSGSTEVDEDIQIT